MRDLRHVQPCAVQMFGGQFANARHGDGFDRAEFAPIRLRNQRNAHFATRWCGWFCRRCRGRGRGHRCANRSLRNHRRATFANVTHIGFGNAPVFARTRDFCQINAQFTRNAAHGWAGMSTAETVRINAHDWGRSGCSRGSGSRNCRWCWRRAQIASPCHFQHQNQTAFGDFIADGNFQLFHHARFRGRDFHRGFVGFERNQRGFRFNHIAFAHQHFNDIHIFEIANVRHANFFQTCRCRHRHGYGSRRAAGYFRLGRGGGDMNAGFARIRE